MAANSTSGGVGTLTVVLIVFVILKLTHLIKWSWWWVLSPLWIIPALLVGLLAVFVVMFCIRYYKRKLAWRKLR